MVVVYTKTNTGMTMKKLLLSLILIGSSAYGMQSIGLWNGFPVFEDVSGMPFIIVDEDDQDFDEIICRARGRVGIRVRRPNFPPPVNRPR